MSVVIPAFNEEQRLEIMLEEAVEFLDREYGRAPRAEKKTNGHANGTSQTQTSQAMGGYEILLVNDGSTDKTVDVALAFAKKNNLHDIMRVCTLKQNRGKGGAVTHGFRHVRGAYVVFADADGASKFEDLKKLVTGCKEVEDQSARGIAVGSRAHLVGSEAVVKVCPTSLQTFYLCSNTSSALSTTQRSNALLPPPPPSPNTTRHLAHPRHTMRIQALLTSFFATYYSLYACRRLDLRC